MATALRTNYYAAGRSATLNPEDVHIFSRSSIYEADPSTDEGKIYAISGTVDAIVEHSGHGDRETQAFREEIRTTMLSPEGMEGGE